MCQRTTIYYQKKHRQLFYEKFKNEKEEKEEKGTLLLEKEVAVL